MWLKSSYASATPVTDGERVYAWFGEFGLLVALPLTGYGELITGNETLLANQAVRHMMAAWMDRSANRCWRDASHQTRFNPYASH